MGAFADALAVKAGISTQPSGSGDPNVKTPTLGFLLVIGPFRGQKRGVYNCAAAAALALFQPPRSFLAVSEACGAAQLQPPFFAHQRGPRIYEPSCPSSSSSRTTAAGERPAPRVCVVGSRKSANIHVSSEIIWGITAQFTFFPLPLLLRENRILYKPG